MNLTNAKPAILGLGYVGVPLSVKFAKPRPVIAFDINHKRIADLQAGRDHARETTPIDASKAPDLAPLTRARETIGKHQRASDTVIFESTANPCWKRVPA